ncbi:hypothetical protein Pen01_48140 [Phytomonospora endophytica]|nr:hypothetical protein Pen01_48140 [Phytomonospora endophytica]
MTNDPSPKRQQNSGADQGWAVISYLLAGMLVWGGAGWLLDWWLNIPHHLATFFGGVGGAGAGLYMVVKKMGNTS